MENNNLILAVVLSLLILLGFQYFYAKPQPTQIPQQALQQPGQPAKPGGAENVTTLRERAIVVKEDPRLPIVTSELRGSINLKGARIDDLALTHYHETIDPNSPAVTLLSPAGSAAPYLAYYADFSWLSDGDAVPVPTAQSEWKAAGKTLTPDHPVTLSWNNGKGLVFERIVSIDNDFMFTLTDRVRNTGANPVTLYPFGLIARQGLPPEMMGAAQGRNTGSSSRILHQGPLGVFNGTLDEYTYKKLMDDGKKTIESKGGWLGMTDKYWLIAMVMPSDEGFTAEFNYNGTGQTDPNFGYFQTDFRSNGVVVAPGSVAEHKAMLFAGAKRVRLLDHYANSDNIPHFDRAIDFGWFYFLTKPFLYLLDYLSQTLGSFAFAILIFTVMLKLVTLPLTLKSSHSMSKMKALQPEMKRIQERFKDDKVRQSQEMMELYKREKVSPLSGCVPTMIQIPIFFALYKVLYVGIEMRQAPFYGWIHDLSAPDPSSIFTLFGMVPWTPPAALQIGVWPVLMGCSMFLQQRLSPQPPDKSQARMFAFLPIMFTYMLRNMPAGLVIYWTWSNLLSIVQQWYIMRQDLKRQGKV